MAHSRTHAHTHWQVMKAIVFQNQVKVVDLSRPQLVASNLEQSQVSCTREEKVCSLLMTGDD